MLYFFEFPGGAIQWSDLLNIRISNEFRTDTEVASLYRDLNDRLEEMGADLEHEIKRFEADAADNHILYAGRPLSIGFYPVIYSRRQASYVSSVAEAIVRLMEKVTTLYLREPSVRDFFGFSPEQIELIEVDPGYDCAIPCARLDSFFDGEDVRFTEINTDGTAGMDGAEKVVKLFLASPTISELFSARSVTAFDINQAVLHTLLDCYTQFAGPHAADAPRIAIVDWQEVRTSAEFVAFREFCAEQGYETVVADPRELEYDGATLSHEGSKIDLIYRRVVSSEYLERLDEVEAMTRAFKDRSVCLVGSFRSDVAFNKNVFALVQHAGFSRFFAEDERALAQKHIPWTRRFADVECEHEGRVIAMPELVREQKDDFVLKPSNLYEGRGVYLGFQKTPSEWEEIVGAALAGDYVLQRFVPEPTLPVGAWKDGFGLEPRFIHLGEFVFGGKFSGFYCRAAEGPLIDRTSREQLVPCFVLDK